MLHMRQGYPIPFPDLKTLLRGLSNRQQDGQLYKDSSNICLFGGRTPSSSMTWHHILGLFSPRFRSSPSRSLCKSGCPCSSAGPRFEICATAVVTIYLS